MTNLREAAQRALDALEHGLPIIEDYGGKQHIQLQHKAIAALYEALRAALATEPPCKTGSQCVGGKCERCAVQEPVAWMVKQSKRIPQFFEDKKTARVLLGVAESEVIPLYTAPPQREWQGLTDEEYESMAEKHVTNYFFDTLKYARAIETKLRVKNGNF